MAPTASEVKRLFSSSAASARDDDDSSKAVLERVQKRQAEDEARQKITRLQMVDFLSSRQWWIFGQKSFIFTVFLWGSFMMIVWQRTNGEGSFEVANSLERYVLHVMAHPSLSGVPPRLAKDTPLPCRCACRDAGLGPPLGPCGGLQNGQSSEIIDLLGRVPYTEVANLGLRAGGVEEASPIRFGDISTRSDAWYWIEHGIIPTVWKPHDGRALKPVPGLLLRRNLIIGGVRARQFRAKPRVACDLEESLRPLYPFRCRSLEPAHEHYAAPVLKGDLAAAERAFVQVPGEPGVFDAMLNLNSPMDQALRTWEILGRSGWTDNMTRSLKLEAALLNAEAGYYSLLDISFEFPLDGSVARTVRIRALPVAGSFTVRDFIPEIIWIILIGLLLRQELFQMLSTSLRCRVREYFGNLWNTIDWLSIVIGLPVALYWILIAMRTSSLSSDVVSLPRPPSVNMTDEKYQAQWGAVVDDLRELLHRKAYYQICLFWYTCILTLRFFKSCLTQQKLASIQISLSRGSADLCHFMTFFAALLANFVLGGRILFGSELKSWSSVAASTETSLQMLLGNLEFGPMYLVAPVSATIWFWLFLTSIIFLLSNVLLAMLCSSYKQLRASVGHTRSLVIDIKDELIDLIWRASWRKDCVRDGEYKDALSNPYDELLDGLMDLCELDDEAKAASRKHCLGIRLTSNRIDATSLEDPVEKAHPGMKPMTALDMRRCGVDASTADHLLADCLRAEEVDVVKQMSLVQQLRQFVKIVRSHKEEMDRCCTAVEVGTEEAKLHLWQALKRLELSLRSAHEKLAGLRETGADSYFPQIPWSNYLPDKLGSTYLLDKIVPNIQHDEPYERQTDVLRIAASMALESDESRAAPHLGDWNSESQALSALGG